MLNYNIKGTAVVVSDELRSYVEKSLGRMEKFLNGDSAHADIELEFSQMRDGGKYRAEFTLSAAGALHRAENWGSTLHEAIDVAAAELDRELRRSKNKRVQFFRRGALKVKEYMRGWRGKI